MSEPSPLRIESGHRGEIRSDFLSPGYTAHCSCGWVGQGDDEVWPTSRAAEAQLDHYAAYVAAAGQEGQE